MDRAYTWYVNLKPRSVHELEHLVSLFNTKLFFCFSFWLNSKNVQISKEWPRRVYKEILWEGLGLLWSSGREGVFEELFISSFSSLMETARRTNKSGRKKSMSSFVIRPSLLSTQPKKRPMIAAIENDKGAKACSSKKAIYSRRETRGYLVYHPFHAERRNWGAPRTMGEGSTYLFTWGRSSPNPRGLEGCKVLHVS